MTRARPVFAFLSHLAGSCGLFALSLPGDLAEAGGRVCVWCERARARHVGAGGCAHVHKAGAAGGRGNVRTGREKNTDRPWAGVWVKRSKIFAQTFYSGLLRAQRQVGYVLVASLKSQTPTRDCQSVDYQSHRSDPRLMQEADALTLLAFGSRLRAVRVEHQVSQEALAELADLDRTYISLLERGKRNPSLVCVSKLAQALGVTISVLCDFSNEGET